MAGHLCSSLGTHRVICDVGRGADVLFAPFKLILEDGSDLLDARGIGVRDLVSVWPYSKRSRLLSFAAVRRTLRRRLLMLTIHEAVLKDQDLDIDGREKLFEEARELIRDEYGLGEDQLSRGEADRILAESKLKLLKKMSEEELELVADEYGTEFAASHAEDLAASTINLALPEERLRIHDVLSVFPTNPETKAEKLLQALGTLWKQNPDEKVVIFATYLGTVDLLGREIESTYPGQGVVVLRGGDHAAKLAAERRFLQKEWTEGAGLHCCWQRRNQSSNCTNPFQFRSPVESNGYRTENRQNSSLRTNTYCPNL